MYMRAARGLAVFLLPLLPFYSCRDVQANIVPAAGAHLNAGLAGSSCCNQPPLLFSPGLQQLAATWGSDRSGCCQGRAPSASGYRHLPSAQLLARRSNIDRRWTRSERSERIGLRQVGHLRAEPRRLSGVALRMLDGESGPSWDGPIGTGGPDPVAQATDASAEPEGTEGYLTLDELLAKVEAYSPTLDRELISKAFKFAEKAHEGQKRRSGEPYFIHPVSVANIIADMKLDTASIVTGLLHDTVEDTSASLELIEKEFGEEIAQLVDGVTKIGKIQFTSKEEAQAENFRKMIVAMARDIRVILVKLADRTHNIRTLKHVPPKKQKQVAKETLDLFAPLAHRLGIFWLKTELEDTSLRYLHPEIYQQLKVMVATKREQRQAYTDEVVQILQEHMKSAGLDSASVKGRAKHFYSIYQKMQSQGLGFDEVQDLIAFRILVEDLGQCYQALGIVHSMWKPVPGRFKDYIALPKPNMYRSLHTTVIGPAGQRIEIQIRTREMHQVAEEGIAAHWMYKGESQGVEEARRFSWLRQLVEWVQQLNDPQEFLHYIKEDLFEKEVFVFSPKGHLYALPKGSSVIDFAYRVHSDLGNHCIGARVNGRMVPLKHQKEGQVNNGDTVEVIQSPNQTPHRDWLGIARTSKAQARIRQWIKQQQREKSVALGRELLEKELKRYANRPGTRNAAVSAKEYKEKLEYVLASLNLADEEQLLAALGYGQITVGSFIQVFFGAPDEEEEEDVSRAEANDAKVLRNFGGKSAAANGQAVSGDGVLVGGERNVLIGFCRHCSPLCGEEVKGVITRGRGIKVHRVDCEHLLDSEEERRVDVCWDSEAKITARAVSLEVECEDAPGMLASMSRAISSAGVNIGSVVLKKLPNGRGLARFEVLLSTAEEFERVTRQLQKERGVLSVARGAMYTRKGKKRRVIRNSVVPPNLMSDN